MVETDKRSKEDKNEVDKKPDSLRKILKRTNKAKNLLADYADKTNDGIKLAKRTRQLVAQVEEDAENLMEREKFEGAFKVIHNALNGIEKQVKPRIEAKIQDGIDTMSLHVVYESLFRLNSTMAQVYHDQDNFEGSLRFLEYAMEQSQKFISSNSGPLYDLLPAEVYLNAANLLSYLGKDEQALHAAGKAEELCGQTLMQLNNTLSLPKAKRPFSIRKSERLVEAQQDLQILCLKAVSDILNQLDQPREARMKLNEGMVLLEQNFGPDSELLTEMKSQLEALDQQIAARGGHQKLGRGSETWVMPKDKNISQLRLKGRIVRSYYKVTKRVHQKDMRPRWTLKEKRTRVGDLDNEIHEERLYAQQLMNMRNMQDEKYRVMELMLATRAATQRATACVYYPAQPCVMPDEEEEEVRKQTSESDDTESSEEAEVSSDEYEEAVEQPTQVNYEEVAWTVVHKAEVSETSHAAVESTVEQAPIHSKFEELKVKEAGTIFSYDEMCQIKVVEAPKIHVPEASIHSTTSISARSEDPTFRMRVITKLQAAVRGWLTRARIRIDLMGVLCRYWVRYKSCRAMITVKSIKAKRTKSKKWRHIKNDQVTSENQKIEEEELIDAFYVIVQSENNHESEKTQIIRELPPRNYLIDYLREALTVNFGANCNIESISYRMLELWEIDQIESYFHRIQDEWERNWALRVTVHETDYFSDANDAHWRTATIFKKRECIETEIERVARVRAQVEIWANQQLTQDERRLMVQFEARQLMTQGAYRNQKIKLLKKYRSGQKRIDSDGRVVHVNSLEMGHLVLVRHMRHINKIINMQRLIRGFLGRMKFFAKRYRLLCKFEHIQRDIKFNVSIYKIRQNTGSFSTEEYRIRVSNKATGQMYTVGFGRIGIDESQMATRLKTILEIILSGNDIVGVRFGKIQKQTVQTDQKHEFILDWNTPTALGEHLIREFRHRYANKGQSSQDYDVKFLYVNPEKMIENSDSDAHGWNHPHYRVDVIPAQNQGRERDATAYIRFSQPPQKISWMLYYLRETLAIYLEADQQTIRYPALLHPKDGEEGFKGRMHQLEREFQIDIRGVTAFSGDNTTMVEKKSIVKQNVRQKHADRIKIKERKRETSRIQKLRATQDQAKALQVAEDRVDSQNFVINQSNPTRRASKGPTRTDKFEPSQDDHAVQLKFQLYHDGESYDIYQTYRHPIFMQTQAAYQWHIVAVKHGQPSNYDYVGLKKLKFSEPQHKPILQQWLKKNLKINIYASAKTAQKEESKTKKSGYTSWLIDSIALTNLKELSTGIVEMPSEEEDNSYKDVAATSIKSFYKMWKMRRWLETELKGVVAIFYMTEDRSIEKSQRCVARITVKKVSVRRTSSIKRTRSQVGQESERSVIGSETKTDMVEAYQIIAENAKDQTNTKEKVVQNLPTNALIVDYLRAALTVIWQAGVIVDIKYTKLDNSELDGLSSVYQKYGKQITQVTKAQRWAQCASWHRDGVTYTIFTTDITAEVNGSFIRVLATKGELIEDEEPEQVFKRSDLVARRDFSALECFMILHPTKDVTGMSTRELENKIGYAENVDIWEKFIQSFSVRGTQGFLDFDEGEFKLKRFGFNVGQMNDTVRQTRAVGKIQRAVRAWLIRKRTRAMRKRPGFMTQTGIFRLNSKDEELVLVYVMMGNYLQDKFSFTLKERTHKVTVVSQRPLKDRVIREATDAKNRQEHDFVLQGAGAILQRFMNQGAPRCCIDKHNEIYDDWKERLAKGVMQEMC